jgi:hypothetical protein
MVLDQALSDLKLTAIVYPNPGPLLPYPLCTTRFLLCVKCDVFQRLHLTRKNSRGLSFHAAGAAQREALHMPQNGGDYMNAEFELGLKLVVFLITSGLVLLELTRPRKKNRQSKWR